MNLVRRVTRRQAGIAGAMSLPVAALMVVTLLAAGRGHLLGILPWQFGFGSQPPPVVTCPVQAPRGPYAGVSPGTPWRRSLARFKTVTRTRPRMAASYVPFGAPFNSGRACFLAASGGLLLIQMIPHGYSLTDIAAGRFDNYLKSYADTIAQSQAPVVFSFAHEMNGSWYPWGFTRIDPAVWIAAWRHVHDVFTAEGATSVIWCWNVTQVSSSPMIADPHAWWPGSRYVNWVGVDAYYNTPASNFGTVFGATFTEVRRFTSKPILIAETAAAGPGQAGQIRNLFSGMRASGAIGVVWFDIDRREAWRLEVAPSSVAAWRAGVASLGEGK